MRMLERHFNVSLKYGGGFVESIDGRSGTLEPPRLVLLRERDRGLAGRGRDGGQQGRPDLVGPARLGRDRHDPRRRRLVPGAVPARQRRPAVPDGAAVRERRERGVRAGLGASSSSLGVPRRDPADRDGLGHRLARGRRRHLARHPRARSSRACSSRARRPAASTPSSRAAAPRWRCSTLAAQSARTLGAGAGLVAATAQGSDMPTWLITGTDVAGVDRRGRGAHAGRAPRPLRARRPGLERRSRSRLRGSS